MKKNIIIIHSLIVLPLLASSPLLGMDRLLTQDGNPSENRVIMPPVQRKLIRQAKEKAENSTKKDIPLTIENPENITIADATQKTTPVELTATHKEVTPEVETTVVPKSDPIPITPRIYITEEMDAKRQEKWGSVIAQLHDSVLKRKPAELPTINVTTKVTPPAETVVAQNIPLQVVTTTEETKTTPTIETPSTDKTEIAPTLLTAADNTNVATETDPLTAEEYFGPSVIENTLVTSTVDEYTEINNLFASVYEPVMPTSKGNLTGIQRGKLWINPATYILAALKDGSFNPTWLEHQEGLNTAIKYLISKQNTSDLLEILTLCRQKHASAIQLDIDTAMAADAYLTEQDYRITNPLRIEVLQKEETYIAQEHVILATLTAKLIKTLKECADEIENGHKTLNENYLAHQQKRAPSISHAQKSSLQNQEAVTYVHKFRRTDLGANGIMAKDYEKQFTSAAGISARITTTDKHITSMEEQYIILQRAIASTQVHIRNHTESQQKLLKQ